MRVRTLLVAIGLCAGVAAGLTVPTPSAARQSEECNNKDCFWTSGSCRTLFGSNCTLSGEWGCEVEIC